MLSLTSNPNYVPAKVTITKEPENLTLKEGYTGAKLTVGAEKTTEAGGADTISYQWYEIRDGKEMPIAGATSDTLSIPDGLPANTSKQYLAKVTVGGQTVTSSTATVTVGASVSAPTLTVGNISKTYDGKSAEITNAKATVGGKEIKGTWEFADGQDVTNVPRTNNHSTNATVVFTPDDADKYAQASTKVTVTIDPASIKDAKLTLDTTPWYTTARRSRPPHNSILPARV